MVLMISAKAWAQPDICGANPAMTSLCKDACIICDIDGFTGRNNSNIIGQAPPGFCTSKVHHMQWIGFIAGSTNLTLEVKVSNCADNNGLEIGLYRSTDCTNFSRVSECDTDVRPGETRVFINTVPLVIGQYYYFVMDGSDNDICDWTIRVTNGTTKVAPLETAPALILPNRVCLGDELTMETPGITGATFYNWSVDGAHTASGLQAVYKPEKSGTYQVCLDASNVCDEAPRICKTVEVLPIPQSVVQQQICYGECFNFFGEKYCQTGKYDHFLQAENGCDSIVYLDLIVDDRITASTSINLCDGDTLKLGDGVFYTDGPHQAVIKNEEGCDIYMDVNVKLIECNIMALAVVNPPLCNGENSGFIDFEVGVGTPPLHYSGYKLENPSVTFSGTILQTGQAVNIPGLDVGSYYITTIDDYGNSHVLTVQVPQPALLEATVRSSDINGYNLACHGDKDAFIRLQPSGGTPPYTFEYQGNVMPSDSLAGLGAGEYSFAVIDKNGCTSSLSVKLEEPDALNLSHTIEGPDCTSVSSAKITADASGGVPPYLFRIDDGTYRPSAAFDNVGPGQYLLEVIDASGCTDTTAFRIREIMIPAISVNSVEQTIRLGDSLVLEVFTNLAKQTVLWSPAEDVACPQCPETTARPVNDTGYEVTVTSEDGCETKATIRVTVNKTRSFVISNVFTPNNDGVNDRITFFAGNDVAGIRYFRVYDRWGNLVYQTSTDSHGVSEMDWNGEINGSKVVSGAYTWMCEVEYIDKVTRLYKGSLTVIR